MKKVEFPSLEGFENLTTDQQEFIQQLQRDQAKFVAYANSMAYKVEVRRALAATHV